MVGLVDSAYENARKQRIEENKKRLQELGIREISEIFAASNVLISPARCSPVGQSKGSRPRIIKEKVKVKLRRSTRNSGNPPPDYQEIEVEVRRRARFDNAGAHRHYSRLYERTFASDEARMGATSRAESIKEGLPLSHPSFVKPMLQSHVTGGFWLGLPVSFCRDHLPKRDDRIVLEDEKNEEWETIYLANKNGLSGGWRGFSLDHGLVDGDALVFELVQPLRFKIHVVRACEPNREDSEETLEEHAKEGMNELPNDLSKQSQSSNVRQKLVREAEVVMKKEVKTDDVSLTNQRTEKNQAGSVNEKEVFIPYENAQNEAHRTKEKEANHENQPLRIKEDAAELYIDLLCNGNSESEALRIKPSELPDLYIDLLCNGNSDSEALRIKPSELPDAITESSIRGSEDCDVETNHNEMMKENNTKTRKRKAVSFADDDHNESKKMKEITSYLRCRKQLAMDVEKRVVLRKRIEASRHNTDSYSD